MSRQEEDFKQEKINLNIWLEIIGLLSKHKVELVYLLLLMVVVATCDASLPYINKIVFDSFVGKTFTNDKLYLLVAVYTFIVFVQAICVYYFFYWAGRVELDFSAEVRRKGFMKIQELSLSYFDKTANGWILARLGNDIARLAEIISWGLLDLFWGLAVMIFIAIIMLVVNFYLALVVLITVPLLAYLSVWFQKKIHRKYQETRRINSQITASFSEGINGVKTSKTLVLEENNINEFSVLTDSMCKKSIEAAFYRAMFLPIVLSVSALSLGALLWYGGVLTISNSIMVGTLLLFTQYAGQFFEPLRQIAGLLADMQMAQTSAQRVLSLLNQEVTIVDSQEVIEKYGSIWEPKYENYEPLIGDIEFKNVSFSYVENETILKDFSLKVSQKELVALVGATGGGKSTIVNLLARFYEPLSGEILIDGIDYRKRSIGWLHSNMGYVLQSPHLFDDTILENVRYGNNDITDQNVIDSCKMVNADDFIVKLPDGYLTRVGEGGNRLSSGQKQLISFARALVNNPKLLILDEATSAVDSKNEEVLQKAIEVLLKDRTCFIIAHRLSTIVKANKILVIKEGKIVEQGTYEELLENRDYFYQLHQNQQFID